MKQRGFTIIEILVVIAVIGIVGVIITEIFFNTLKGNNKANLISKIKQNGQSATELMDKTIRNADAVVCLSASNDVIEVQKNGLNTRFAFIPSTSAINGYISIDSPSDIDCEITHVKTATPALVPITENATISLDSIPTPQFSRSKSPGFKDVVSISFALKPGIGSSSTLQIDPIPFATTIQLR